MYCQNLFTHFMQDASDHNVNGGKKSNQHHQHHQHAQTSTRSKYCIAKAFASCITTDPSYTYKLCTKHQGDHLRLSHPRASKLSHLDISEAKPFHLTFTPASRGTKERNYKQKRSRGETQIKVKKRKQEKGKCFERRAPSRQKNNEWEARKENGGQANQEKMGEPTNLGKSSMRKKANDWTVLGASGASRQVRDGPFSNNRSCWEDETRAALCIRRADGVEGAYRCVTGMLAMKSMPSSSQVYGNPGVGFPGDEGENWENRTNPQNV
jgi:hypothetical protein